MKITGSSLRLNRQQLGLSQAKLAEIAGIPQHLLSAFELGKIELASTALDSVTDVLADNRKVAAVVQRAKRYRAHEYATVPRLPERIALAQRTEENVAYLALLDDLAAGHASDDPRPLSALSLFSGAGGFSLGFSAAGFAIKGFVEIDAALRSIYRLNFPHSTELGGDITDIAQDALEAMAWTLGGIDVIIGGPPCQGFSLSGKRDIHDPRNQLFRHYCASSTRSGPWSRCWRMCAC